MALIRDKYDSLDSLLEKNSIVYLSLEEQRRTLEKKTNRAKITITYDLITVVVGLGLASLSYVLDVGDDVPAWIGGCLGGYYGAKTVYSGFKLRKLNRKLGALNTFIEKQSQ